MKYVYKSPCGNYYLCSNDSDCEWPRVDTEHEVGDTVLVDYDSRVYIGKVRGFVTISNVSPNKGLDWAYVIQKYGGRPTRIPAQCVYSYTPLKLQEEVHQLRNEVDFLKESLTRVLAEESVRELEEGGINIKE